MRRQVAFALLALLLLGQFVLRAELSLRQKSPVWDESMHLHYGLNFLRLGPEIDPRDHPYPVTCLFALPLRWTQASPHQYLEGTRPAAGGFDVRVIEDPNNLFPPRRVNVALAALGLLAIALLAGRLYGQTVGIVTLFLGSLDPGWLAHARFITTDIAHALAFSLGALGLWRFRQVPAKGLLILGALCVAFALWSKFSGALLLPFAVWILLAPLPHGSAPGEPRRDDSVGVAGPGETGSFRRRVGISLAVTLGGLLVYVIPFLLHSLAGAIPFSAIVAHFGRALEVFSEVRSIHRGSFLLGEFDPDGHRLFYPVLLLAKTPITLLSLTLLAAAVPEARRMLLRHAPLFVVPVAYLAVAMTSRVTLGHRHLAPIWPFLWVSAAIAICCLARSLRSRAPFATQLRGWLLPILVLAVLALEVVPEHPHYLPFTNRLFGGRDGAHRIAVDSSSDWGQDLPALASYLARHPVREGLPHLAYFGNCSPRYFGIDAVWRPCGKLGALPWTPQRAPCPAPAELLAVSATCLQGAASHATHDDCYARLRDREPEAILGGSILVFRQAP